MGRGGFRLDWEPSEQNRFTLQGDVYSGTVHQTFTVATPAPPFVGLLPDKGGLNGGNVLGRWTHTFSEQSELQLQAYYDRTSRDLAIIGEARNTLDFDLQHRFALGERNELVWGLGYRATMDDTRRSFQLALNPDDRTLQLLNAFVQDTITIAPDRLKLILGTKIEHNDITGVELQPNARLLWTPHEQHSLWASVSRAVRTPSRGEVDLSGRLPGPVPFPPGSYIDVAGNPALRAEELTSYELGYRLQPHKNFSTDLALFYNDYDRLSIPVPGMPTPGFPFVLPFGFDNELRGETYGAELEATWQAASWWRLKGSYTFLEAQLHRSAGLPPSSEDAEGESPHHQFQFRSIFDLPKNFEFDASVRYVDELTSYNQPGYLALDLRLGWHPQRNVELSFGVRNLLDNRHPEFSPDSFVPTQQTEVPRSFYGKMTIRF